MSHQKVAIVTGGAGFLGSHLCDRLLQANYQVICVDNFFTGNLHNIAHLQDLKTFHVIKHDIIQPLQLGQLPASTIDEIYNLACPASPVHYQHDPVYTMKTSVWGMYHMLELAKATGATVFQASTSEVYGDPLVHPQPESYRGNVNPVGPRACYDEGKRAAETLCFDYYHSHGIPMRMVRIFNTYGPRMHPEDGRVVSNFIVQALKSAPLSVYGDGSQTRSFCYVDDLINGFIALMQAPGGFVGPVNLGNPGEFTILQLAHLVLEMTGSTSTITYKPLPKDDPLQRKPVINMAQERLHWQPTVALRDGLAKTIEYFKQVLN